MDAEIKRFVEFHILQSFPPSNPNRDDANNPKEALFGGVRRARISSQSFKRAIRKAKAFRETVGEKHVGTRTARLIRFFLPYVREAYVQAGKEADAPFDEPLAALMIRKVCELLYTNKWDQPKQEDAEEESENAYLDMKTKVLVYLSEAEGRTLGEVIVEKWDALAEMLANQETPKKEETQRQGRRKNRRKREPTAVESAVAAIKERLGIMDKEDRARIDAADIALFGRMLAQKKEPVFNVDAATQVAHAISTHRITMERDFFTAVDDITQDSETGAGMMGHLFFNSATFYRYLRVDWKQLVDNLNGDEELARRAIEGFIRAMIEAVPSGKQNAHAHNVAPDLIFGVVREGSFAWSLVNAFERPVRPDREEGGYMRPSIEALDRYWGWLVRVYGEDSVKAKAVLAMDEEAPLDALKKATVGDMESFIETIMGALPDEEA